MTRDEFERKEKEILEGLFDCDRKLCMTIASTYANINNTPKIMIVGRALNGWDTIQETNFEDFYKKLVEEFRTNNENKNALNRLYNKAYKRNEKNKYNSARSAFWRVVRQISEKHVDNIVWTNLYKVSPKKGGNPSEKLKEYQFIACKKLLDLEIEYYNPQVVIFITNKWADKFIENPIIIQNYRSDFVKYIGYFGNKNNKFIVTVRPEGQKEKLWLKDVKEAMSILLSKPCFSVNTPSLATSHNSL